MPWWMIQPGKPGIALYVSSKTTKKDTYACHNWANGMTTERGTAPFLLSLDRDGNQGLDSPFCSTIVLFNQKFRGILVRIPGKNGEMGARPRDPETPRRFLFWALRLLGTPNGIVGVPGEHRRLLLARGNLSRGRSSRLAFQGETHHGGSKNSPNDRMGNLSHVVEMWVLPNGHPK